MENFVGSSRIARSFSPELENYEVSRNCVEEQEETSALVIYHFLVFSISSVFMHGWISSDFSFQDYFIFVFIFLFRMNPEPPAKSPNRRDNNISGSK